VEKHFEDFIDDQFDFHSYCVRKMTLRAYVASLQLSERIGHHVAFQRACGGAVQVEPPPPPCGWVVVGGGGGEKSLGGGRG
jgi:hypothetical protein